MRIPLPSSLDPVVLIARAFGPLVSEVVFLGGAILPLLVTDTAAAPARGTDDVDVVIEAQSRPEYYEFESSLRTRGFRNDTSEGAPLCRWIFEGIKVDVMPDDPKILGFSNTWYREVLGSAVPVDLVQDLTIRLISPTAFLATKFEAFWDPQRGAGDFAGSKDLEDVIALVDGRPELDEEIRDAGGEIQSYLGKAFQDLLDNPRFHEALPGHFPGDAAGQARLPRAVALLRTWAEELPKRDCP